MPKPAPNRPATAKTSLTRNGAGKLITIQLILNIAQVYLVFTITQLINPDVLLINYVHYDASGEAVNLFNSNHLDGGGIAVERSCPTAVKADISTSADGDTSRAVAGFLVAALAAADLTRLIHKWLLKRMPWVIQKNCLRFSLAGKSLRLGAVMTPLLAISFI